MKNVFLFLVVAAVTLVVACNSGSNSSAGSADSTAVVTCDTTAATCDTTCADTAQ